MEEITIYKFQLDIINEALRLTKNIYVDNKETGQTCYDRQVIQAKQYTENALEGNYKTRVNYITGKNETS